MFTSLGAFVFAIIMLASLHDITLEKILIGLVLVIAGFIQDMMS